MRRQVSKPTELLKIGVRLDQVEFFVENFMMIFKKKQLGAYKIALNTFAEVSKRAKSTAIGTMFDFKNC